MSDCNGNCTTCVLNEKTGFAPISAVVNITDQCNLRCKYCFVNHNPSRMTLETARQTAEYLLKNGQYNKEGKKPSFWFFGGEPMLEFESIIKPIIEEYNDRLSFGITTNGVFLTEDIVDYFHSHGVSILFSMDGCKEVQDYQRPFANGEGSFSAIVKNIPYLLMVYPDLLFRATLTAYAIPYMNKSYDFARHMGFKRISFVINEGEDYTEEDYKEMVRQYNKIALKILKGSPLKVDDFVKAETYNKEPKEKTLLRCGYGTTSFGVTTDGEINPCQELSSLHDFSIGSVYTGIDNLIHQSFLSKANKETPLPEGLSPQQQRFLRNGVCPKHQYLNNDFTVTIGRQYQLCAMAEVFNHLNAIAKKSTNRIFRGVFA